MRNIMPWVGLRIPLSSTTSVLVKFFNANVSYSYPVDEGVVNTRKAVLSNFTGALYHQKESLEAYGSLSVLVGSDGYSAQAFDVGVSRRIAGPVHLEIGTYILREDSILWYPDDPHRTISVYSIRGGIKIKVGSWLTLNPRYHIYRNSEDVNASALAFGVILTPAHPFALTLYYFRYSESAQYRFSGDYFSAGFSLYY